MQPRVLVVTSSLFFNGLVSGYLTMMECECALATTITELEIASREHFDASLIDDGIPWLEHAIRKLHPVFAQKIVVAGRHTADRSSGEFARSFGLWYLPEHLLTHLLWPALQDVLVDPASLARGTEIAQLDFDSYSAPASHHFRGSETKRRQLAYRYQGIAIDVLIEPDYSGGVRVAGQVLDENKSKGDNAGLLVMLMQGDKPMARALTNLHGEFTFHFDPPEEVGIEIRLRKGVWVSVPIGKMGAIKTRLAASNSADGIQGPGSPT